MAPTALAAAMVPTLAAVVVAEPAAAAATAATSAPVAAVAVLVAEPELAVAAVTVAKSAPLAEAAVAQMAAAPVVKCPRCSRLLMVRLDQYFAAVLQSPGNSRLSSRLDPASPCWLVFLRQRSGQWT